MGHDPQASAAKPLPATGNPAGPVNAPHGQLIAELFTRYHTKLVKSLVARMGSWEEARDVASQAFAEVLAQRSGAVNFLGPYLYRTARNIATNRLTHAAICRRKASIMGQEPDREPSPDILLEACEHAAILQRVVAQLSPRVRMAFVLRVWDELPYEEIASRFAATGVTVTTRTLQRHVAEALERCRRAILTAQAGSAKEIK